ncbi:addiction module antidote protein [Bdellovibrionota bacterium FG-1]
MPKRTRNYEKDLVEDLKKPEEAAAYLNAHLDDDTEDAEELFLIALRDVAKAHGMGDIADRAQLGRESLYKALSTSGNPKLTTLRSLLAAMGLRLSIEAREDEKRAS